MADVETLIAAEGVRKVFGSGNTEVVAVEKVDLHVVAGELVLIMGPSGSGKTTLLSMLGGLLRPTEGRIWVAGEELTGLSERRLSEVRRRLVGFVFQSFNLLEALNVVENVEIALDVAGSHGSEARERARTLLSRLGLGERLRFRPRLLSGGEKQRVSLARALVNETRVILADEPTANLDAKNGHEVMALLKAVTREKGRAVVVVSHDERIRSIADRVLWLEDGRLVELGRLEQDPVCRMQVDVKRTTYVDYNGRRLHFCSEGCKREFEEAPESFLVSPPFATNR